MFTKLILLFLALNQVVLSIKVVSDDALITIIQENKDLLILFGNCSILMQVEINYNLKKLIIAKKDCVEDCKYEKNLIKLEEDFEATFAGSRVVKVECLY